MAWRLWCTWGWIPWRWKVGFQTEGVIGVKDFHQRTGNRCHYPFVAGLDRQTVAHRFAGKGFIRHIIQRHDFTADRRQNEAVAKRLGASGVIRLNKQSVQIIVGTQAESIASAMKKVLTKGPVAAAATSRSRRTRQDA